MAILHSFSLFKWRNVQYDGGRPNRIVTRRLEHLGRWAAERRAYPVRTFAELGRQVAEGRYTACRAAPCRLIHPRALWRKAFQAWNNLYWT